MEEKKEDLTLDQWKRAAMEMNQELELYKQIEALSKDEVFRFNLLQKLTVLNNSLQENNSALKGIGNNIAEVGKILDEAQNGAQEEAEPSAEDIELQQAEERLALAKANLQKAKEPVQQFNQEDYKKFDSDNEDEDADIRPENEPEEKEPEPQFTSKFIPPVAQPVPPKKKYVFKKAVE